MDQMNCEFYLYKVVLYTKQAKKYTTFVHVSVLYHFVLFFTAVLESSDLLCSHRCSTFPLGSV